MTPWRNETTMKPPQLSNVMIRAKTPRPHPKRKAKVLSISMPKPPVWRDWKATKRSRSTDPTKHLHNCNPQKSPRIEGLKNEQDKETRLADNRSQKRRWRRPDKTHKENLPQMANELRFKRHGQRQTHPNLPCRTRNLTVSAGARPLQCKSTTIWQKEIYFGWSAGVPLMTRLIGDDRLIIREAHNGQIPKCDCGAESTIWIRGVTIRETEEIDIMGNLFVCDRCGFHLARIILSDIGHNFPKAK